MTDKIITNNKTKEKLVFSEKFVDIELIFESLSIASDNDRELQFMNLLVGELKKYPEKDLTVMCFEILVKLGVVEEYKI